MENAKIPETKSLMSMNWMTVIGLILLLVGALIILMAIGFLRRLSGGGKAQFGGVVLLGPIPIVFGDKNLASILLVVAVVLAIMFMVIAFFIR